MVAFASYASRGQSKPWLIFSCINGPNVKRQADLFGSQNSGQNMLVFTKTLASKTTFLMFDFLIRHHSSKHVH